MPYSSPKLKQILIRVERDSIVLDQLEEKIYHCIKEVETLVEQISNK
jgi:hypothetical protein